MENTNAIAILKKSNGTFENLDRGEVRQLINELSPQLEKLLGTAKMSARFVESMVTICLDSKLVNCDALSVIGAAYTSATLNLSLNPTLGEGYVVPFNCNVAARGQSPIWRKMAQFQIGYNGYKNMAFNAGMKAIHGKAIYKGDEFSVKFGTNASLDYVPKFLSDEILGVYFEWTINGVHKFEYFDKAWVENKRLRNKSQQASKDNPNAEPKDAWKTDYATMAIGKLIKYCRRFFPLSAEFIAMAESDESVLIGKLDESGKLEITPHEELDTIAPVNQEKPKVLQPITRVLADNMVTYIFTEKRNVEETINHYSTLYVIPENWKQAIRKNAAKKRINAESDYELIQGLNDGDQDISLLGDYFFTKTEIDKYEAIFKNAQKSRENGQ